MAKSRPILRTVLIGVLAAAALAGLSFGFLALRKHVASRTWTRFAACLAGPRLAETESAEVRVRRIWMRVSHAPEKLPPDVEKWPDRCGEPARQLAHSWAVRSLLPALRPLAEKVAEQIDDGDIHRHKDDVDLLWAT